ncbi:tetratricopeptide repeat protein [Gemmatimonas sp.]|uniref:tetratricopeptide repeat protein n=1 Tax=Gemmatimonas sp. TaxID=1962908 RepID=UPI00286E9D60|nr:tetratricopeptide repeat protein [Gemmatimonas sp.]
MSTELPAFLGLESNTRDSGDTPHNAAALLALGDAFFRRDQVDEAAAAYRDALRLEPDCIDAANTLGVILAGRGEHTEAMQLFRRLIRLDPSFIHARQNLAQVCIAAGRMQEALEHCLEGRRLDPDNVAIRGMCGVVYRALGHVDEARELYQQWFADDPNDAAVRHYHAAFSGADVPTVASADYVREVFDPFAINFEDTLARLDYAAPQLLGAYLAHLLGAPNAQWRIADAGCGTGLCAPFLRPYASELTGIDLSPRMLEQAFAKGVYDALHEGELVEFFGARPQSFNVIVSADTLCYFGALERFAETARGSLTDGGWLLFTVETLTDEAHVDHAESPPWRLQPHGRYCHQRSYVEATLTDSGFDVTEIEQVVLRREAGQPVNGWLVTARAR